MPADRSRPGVLATAGALTVVLAVLLSIDRVDGVTLADLPMAEPEAVGMSSERLQRITATMQRYIDAN